MANHPSAAKRHRQSLKRRERNRHWRTTVRNAVRKVQQAAAQSDPELPGLLQKAEKLMRKATAKGVFHAKTTSRTVSRLSKLIHRAG